MCCLFGLIDYNHTLSRRQKTRIIRTLAELSEEREEPMLPESLTILAAHSVLISTQEPLIP